MKFEDRLKLLQPAPASEGLRKRIALPERRDVLKWIPLGVAAAGLLAVIAFAMLSGRVETPEEAFRKIESTLVNAKTLRVRFTRRATIQNPQEEVVTSGTMLLKEGNKLHFILRERRNADRAESRDVEFVYISDGKQLKTFIRTKDGLKQAPQGTFGTEMLARRFLLALARNSIATPNAILPFTLGDLDQQWQVFELKRGPQEGTLTYRSGPFQITLWYDSKTHTPIRRVLANPVLGEFTETYEECVPDAAIPDDVFTIPSGS